jgi:hypothetical protein
VIDVPGEEEFGGSANRAGECKSADCTIDHFSDSVGKTLGFNELVHEGVGAVPTGKQGRCGNADDVAAFLTRTLGDGFHRAAVPTGYHSKRRAGQTLSHMLCLDPAGGIAFCLRRTKHGYSL